LISGAKGRNVTVENALMNHAHRNRNTPGHLARKTGIRGTRIMVANILSLPAGGYDVARVLKNYPELTEADVLAALDYAGDVVHDEEVLAPA
jgi:uncharacterized protein (DUF433 family)